MDWTKIDKTIELSNWLDANAKVVARPEDMATGSGKETIYTCPLSKEGEFEKVFGKAFCDREQLDEYGWPEEKESWRVVTGKYEAEKGPYKWRKQGYDFDGFYEQGASGKVECVRYRTFRKAEVYQYHDSFFNRVMSKIDIDSYGDGNYRMLYVVCFVEDADGR